MRGSACDFQKGFSIRREPVEGTSKIGLGTGKEMKERGGGGGVEGIVKGGAVPKLVIYMLVFQVGIIFDGVCCEA